MLFLVIFELLTKYQWTLHTRVGIANKRPPRMRTFIGDGRLKERDDCIKNSILGGRLLERGV